MYNLEISLNSGRIVVAENLTFEDGCLEIRSRLVPEHQHNYITVDNIDAFGQYMILYPYKNILYFTLERQNSTLDKL